MISDYQFRDFYDQQTCCSPRDLVNKLCSSQPSSFTLDHVYVFRNHPDNRYQTQLIWDVTEFQI